jgi:hypothetical protein
VSADRHPEVRGAGGNINKTQASYTEIVVSTWSGLESTALHTFNRSGHGYRDISAAGQNFLIYIQNEPLFVTDTSASAPIIASIFTLINERHHAAGKSRVEFVNPTLYQNPDAFTDVRITFIRP